MTANEWGVLDRVPSSSQVPYTLAPFILSPPKLHSRCLFGTQAISHLITTWLAQGPSLESGAFGLKCPNTKMETSIKVVCLLFLSLLKRQLWNAIYFTCSPPNLCDEGYIRPCGAARPWATPHRRPVHLCEN